MKLTHYEKSRIPLKCELDRELQLPRVADALAQVPIEVEERRGDQRVDIVLAVGRIEHLDDGDKREAVTEPDGALHSPVEREVLVVLARAVAPAVEAVEDARRGRDRLRRPRLDAR